MNENKTVPTDASVEEFLAALTDGQRRSDAERLTALMSEATGDRPILWGQSIIGFGTYHYKSRSGREGDWMRVGFSPGKAKTSLYGLKDHPESVALLEKLGPHTAGVGCVYIKRLSEVDEDVLRSLIALAYQRESFREGD